MLAPRPAYSGTIIQTWTSQDGVVFVCVKTQVGKLSSGPLQAHGATDLINRRVKQIDGRWTLSEQRGAT